MEENIIMKKGLLVTTLFAASALLLASCEKTISFEEAKKHCDDNFTNTELKLFDVHTVAKVTKSEGVFESMYKVGEETDDESGKFGVITSGYVDSIGDKATYKVDGKKLSVEYSLSVKDFLAEQGVELSEGDEASGSIFSKASTDEEGYPASQYEKIDELHFKATLYGVSVEGTLSLEMTVTYTARPAN